MHIETKKTKKKDKDTVWCSQITRFHIGLNQIPLCVYLHLLVYTADLEYASEMQSCIFGFERRKCYNALVLAVEEYKLRVRFFCCIQCHIPAVVYMFRSLLPCLKSSIPSWCWDLRWDWLNNTIVYISTEVRDYMAWNSWLFNVTSLHTVEIWQSASGGW